MFDDPFKGLTDEDIDQLLTFLNEPQPLSRPSILNCEKCNLPNEYAEPNQKNGTYICYNCRT